jgi:hypothetical protein
MAQKALGKAGKSVILLKTTKLELGKVEKYILIKMSFWR